MLNGSKNLGNEATFAATIQSLKRRDPVAQLCGLSLDPEATHQLYRIPAFSPLTLCAKAARNNQNGDKAIPGSTGHHPATVFGRSKASLKKVPLVYAFLKAIRTTLTLVPRAIAECAFLVRVYRRLKHIDLLIVAGAGHLSDQFGGTWAFPYVIFKWTLIARLSRTRIAFLSVGAGPISSPISQRLIKWSLVLADYKSFRDDQSKSWIEKIGVTGQISVCPDLAHNLDLQSFSPAIRADEPQPVVGINPFPHFDGRYWPISNAAAYHDYVDKLASFALWLLANGYFVVFFPTQIQADPLVIQDINAVLANRRIPNRHRLLTAQPIRGLGDLISQLSTLGLVVATRFHGILLSFLMSKPVVAISNHHKMHDLMINMGQSDYLLNISDFDVSSLIQRFTLIEANRNAIRGQLQAKIAAYQAALEAQYDRVLRLVT